MKKKTSLFLLLPAIAMVASSCDLFGSKDKVDDDNTQQTGGDDDTGGGDDSGGDDEVVHVTSISRNLAKYSIEVEESVQIEVTVKPENATNKAVTFKAMSNGEEVTDIVSISSTGLVTGLKEGKVDIVITSVDTPTVKNTIQGFTVNKKAAKLPGATKDGYAKLTSAESLKNGEIVNIAGVIGEKFYGLGAFASATATAITPTELSVDGEAIDIADDFNYTVVKNLDNSLSFMDKNGKYLMFDGTGNIVKPQEFIDAGTKFTVSVDADGFASIVGTNSSIDQRYLALNPNSGNPKWACYKQATAAGYAKYVIYHNGVEAQPVAATGVELLKDAYEVQVGMQVKAGAKVLPADATDKEITYSLRDVSPAGCAVIFNNVITGVATGSATVVATSHDGSHEDTATLTIIGELQPEHAGTLADPFTAADAKIVSDKLGVGGESGTEYYIKGVVTSLIEAFNPSYGNYTFWLDEIFEGYRLKKGSAKEKFSEGDLEVGDTVTICAKIQNYQGTPENKDGYIYSIEKPHVDVTGVSLDKTTLTIEAGSAPVTLVPTVAPANASVKTVSWESNNESVATVVNGVVTPLAAGEATITVTADGGFTATCVVTVTAATRTMTDISVEGPTKTEYEEGQTLDLTGLVVKAVYDSGDPEVISAGYTTSIAHGDTLALTDTSLVVSFGGFEKTITLTINEAQPILAEGTYLIKGYSQDGNTTYYLKENGTSKPTAVTSPDEATPFTFTLKEGTSNEYTIKTLDNRTLYSTSSNDGVRVDENKEFTWIIEEGASGLVGGFNLKQTSALDASKEETARYLTLYNNADFRTYNSATATNRKSNTDFEVYYAKTLESISVTSQPTKTSYYVGDVFDPAGLVVKGHYVWENDGSENKEVTGYELNFSGAFVTEDIGTKTITVTFGEKTATFDVTVEARVATLESISIEGTAKSNYEDGEAYTAEGLSVIAHYSDESTSNVTNSATISITKEIAELGDESITINADYEGKTASKNVTVTVVAANIKETLTVASLGLGSSYGGFSTVAETSGFLLQGNAMTSSSGNIQMRDLPQGSGIYTRTSNRYIKSISFEFENANGKTISVYGQSEGYTSVPSSATGELLGSVTADGKIVVEGNYLNILIASTGATYIKNIVLEWDSTAQTASVSGVTLNKSEVEMGVNDSEALTAIVDGCGCSQDITWSSSNESVATVVDGVVTPVAGGETTIKATSVDNGEKYAECVVTITNQKTVMEADFTTKAASHSDYFDSWEYGDFTLTNGANNKGGWDYVKFGKKSAEQTCTIINKEASTEAIKKIVVTIVSGSLKDAKQTCPEWGVEVYSDAECSQLVDKVVSNDAIVKTGGEYVLTPTDGTEWAAGSYFKVYFNTKDTGSANGVVWVSSVVFIG